MKRLLGTLTIGLSLASLLCAAAPTVTTDTGGVVGSTVIVFRGTVNPGGTNTWGWFQWGTTTNLGNETALQDLSNGVVDVTMLQIVSNLTENTSYYYRAAASNEEGVVTNTTTLWIRTGASSYDFTGTGWEDIDPTRPLGTEPGSVWDDVARQTRQAGQNAMEQEHHRGGLHLDAFLITQYIQDGAVTWDKLDAGTQLLISGGSTTATSYVTNTLAYYTSQETDYTAVQITTTEKQLATLNLASNSFTKVLITAEVYLRNDHGQNHTVNAVDIKVDGSVAKTYGPFLIQPNADQLLTISCIVDASNVTTVPIDIWASSNLGSASSVFTAQVKNMRLWAIP